MPTDYQKIKEQNTSRYGWDIERVGKMLMAERYDDRTHFIFELLQNACDTLKRRSNPNGPRSVQFDLSKNELRVSHHGVPFSEQDVHSICGIGESTKLSDLTAIGHFGIGFKAVYTITDSPEIHSGDEHFLIERFVLPRATEPDIIEPSETLFVFPLRENDYNAFKDIADGLSALRTRTLLFLDEIDEVSWSVEGGQSGLYLRSDSRITNSAKEVCLVGQQHDGAEIEEHWLVFSRAVQNDGAQYVGDVEVAYKISEVSDSDHRSLQVISDSTLVVYFPTVIPVNCGFLIQGPYRTTLSRDNVPERDEWNKYLVNETAELLVKSLHSLRDLGYLNVVALRSLPIDTDKFPVGSRFSPIYEAVKLALTTEPLLPSYNNLHVPASQARLARTQELRDLFNPHQLGSIFGSESDIFWLSSDISTDRTHELRQYLMRELNVVEVAPEAILPKLTKPFLEAQTDEWIVRLYEFLVGLPSLWPKCKELPLIRLSSGTHVSAFRANQPQVYLPSDIHSDFPTICRTVCNTDKSLEFLKSLKLNAPDPVDDVIHNILPKYVIADYRDYDSDIERILSAYAADSSEQQAKLVQALRASKFVRSVDAADGNVSYNTPDAVYISTPLLKDLFSGVSGVCFVDGTSACLCSKDAIALLAACDASRCLKCKKGTLCLTPTRYLELRRLRGCIGCKKGSDTGDDYTVVGLNSLLTALPLWSVEVRKYRTKLLWDALIDLDKQIDAKVFKGLYNWYYVNPWSTDFDAEFIRTLNETAWVPDSQGNLHKPSDILFEETGWVTHDIMQKRIIFKPPILRTLAEEAGFEPEMLEMLKKLGVTSVESLKAHLKEGIESEPLIDSESDAILTPGQTPDTLGNRHSTPPLHSSESEPKRESQNGSTSGGVHSNNTIAGDHTGAPHQAHPGNSSSDGSINRLEFVSYIGIHNEEASLDPDGLEHEVRMVLEAKAIDMILELEPILQRTPLNNPGFDLYESNPDGSILRWIEVKSMTSDLHSRPVGISRTQFDFAQEHGSNFWLYVVEHTGTPEITRIVRIQDPAGKAKTFTFDHGWTSVAEISDVHISPETKDV